MRTKFFHGGNRGLQLGDYILPPTETGAMGMSHPLCRRDRAYVTPSIVDAEFYASGSIKPVVYEVIPDGELEPDPDCNRDGGSFACQKAKIVGIRRIQGKVIKKNKKMMLRIAQKLDGPSIKLK